MTMLPVSEVVNLSGVEKQLTPEEQQIVEGEPQTVTQSPMPLIEITEPEKRIAPLPTTITPTAEVTAATAATTYFVGQPVLVLNRYTGNSVDWQELVRWDIPEGLVGDLHEISLLSNSDVDTRYQIILANVDMQVPLDRATSTPFSPPWRDTKIPGGTSVIVRVRSAVGNAIIVDGSISGTLRSP